MALQHQVTNVLIITFRIQNSSALSLPSWIWPLVIPSSSALDSSNFCNQRAALWKPPRWEGHGYQACCVQTLATGDLVNSLSSSSAHHPFSQVLLRARSSAGFFNNWKWRPWLGHFTLNSPLEEVGNRGCLRQRDLTGRNVISLFVLCVSFLFHVSSFAIPFPWPPPTLPSLSLTLS